MKISNIGIAFIFLLSVGFISCNSGKYKKSDQVEQRIIFQYYHIFYDANSEILNATASFKENNLSGSTIQLNKKSSITFNGMLSNEAYSKDRGYYYFWPEKEASASNGTFHYINNNGDLFLNKIILNKIEAKNSTVTLLKSTGGQIPFSGEKFSQNETLLLTLFDHDDVVEMIEIARPSSGKVSLSQELLSSVNSGTYQGQFTRYNYSADINALDRGGLSETEYISKKFTIKIAN